MNATCPECEAQIALADGTVEGEIITCPDCAAELEVMSVDPPELALAPEVGEDLRAARSESIHGCVHGASLVRPCAAVHRRRAARSRARANELSARSGWAARRTRAGTRR